MAGHQPTLLSAEHTASHPSSALRSASVTLDDQSQARRRNKSLSQLQFSRRPKLLCTEEHWKQARGRTGPLRMAVYSGENAQRCLLWLTGMKGFNEPARSPPTCPDATTSGDKRREGCQTRPRLLLGSRPRGHIRCRRLMSVSCVWGGGASTPPQTHNG